MTPQNTPNAVRILSVYILHLLAPLFDLQNIYTVSTKHGTSVRHKNRFLLQSEPIFKIRTRNCSLKPTRKMLLFGELYLKSHTKLYSAISWIELQSRRQTRWRAELSTGESQTAACPRILLESLPCEAIWQHVPWINLENKWNIEDAICSTTCWMFVCWNISMYKINIKAERCRKYDAQHQMKWRSVLFILEFRNDGSYGASEKHLFHYMHHARYLLKKTPCFHNVTWASFLFYLQRCHLANKPLWKAN